jgi:hypothetical protein
MRLKFQRKKLNAIPYVRDARERVRGLVVRYRRWRLLRAYARVFEARTGKRTGFTPLIAAYQRAEDDGVLELTEDGNVRWKWP